MGTFGKALIVRQQVNEAWGTPALVAACPDVSIELINQHRDQ
jgi:hypothetical protein